MQASIVSIDEAIDRLHKRPPQGQLRELVFDIVQKSNGLTMKQIQHTLIDMNRPTGIGSLGSCLPRIRRIEGKIEKRSDGLWYARHR